MSSPELENLACIGKLKREDASPDELSGLLRSGEERLADAERSELAFSSRFDLAYNAAHAFALHALRQAGYRSDSRYLVFQALPHTAGVAPEKWRVLAKAHDQRNIAEYQGHLDRDDRLLAEMIAVTKELRKVIGGRSPPELGARPESAVDS